MGIIGSRMSRTLDLLFKKKQEQVQKRKISLNMTKCDFVLYRTGVGVDRNFFGTEMSAFQRIRA